MRAFMVVPVGITVGVIGEINEKKDLSVFCRVSWDVQRDRNGGGFEGLGETLEAGIESGRIAA